MSYLNRDDRRAMILDVAKEIALEEGLKALTVRRIALESSISTGQIHHHFQSISHLKAEVFLQLAQKLDELDSQSEHSDWNLRLFIVLGAADIQYAQPYLRLWNEAESMIESDAVLHDAYNAAMQHWHTTLIHVIASGLEHGYFAIHPHTQIHDVAWRLIAFTCGLESIYRLKLSTLEPHAFQTHIQTMIEYELSRSSE